MATTETVTETRLPQWLVDAYTKALTMAGESVGGGYKPYTAGPRIAAFSPQQLQAYDMVSKNVGNYRPYVDAAGNYISGGTKSFTDPGVVAQYMNPYTENVVAGIGSAAGRNLYENLLPQVNRTFVGGGTFGGSRSAEFTARAVRDANAAALSAQNEALQKGYESGMGQFNIEANRYLTAADKAAGLGESIQSMAGKDAAALEAAGRQRQLQEQEALDLLRSDFEAQRDYDYNEAKKYVDLVGRPSASGSGTETTTAPGPNKTAQTLGTIAGAAGTIANIFGGKKDGGPIGRAGIGRMKKAGPVTADGKRNLKHPMHGLGWLKDVK
jgi:hypothetical protein